MTRRVGGLKTKFYYCTVKVRINNRSLQLSKPIISQLHVLFTAYFALTEYSIIEFDYKKNTVNRVQLHFQTKRNVSLPSCFTFDFVPPCTYRSLGTFHTSISKNRSVEVLPRIRQSRDQTSQNVLNLI